MNFINNIEIKNFKSIRHQKIEDCKRVNIFIGYPNVGKSNILEALSMASYLNDNPYTISLNKLCRLNSPAELFNDGDIKKPAEIIFQNTIKVSLYYKNESTLEYNILKNVKDDKINWENLWSFDFNKTGKNINFGNSYYKSDIIKKKPILKFSILKYQFSQNKFETVISALNLISPNGDNLFEVIQHNSNLRNEVAEMFDQYKLKLAFDKTSNTLKILKELQKNVVFQIPFYQIADTLQRLIFYKAAILSNQNSVLLFEEPEAHMFPPYISKFTSDVMYDENKNQFFITTHSPFVINDFMENLKKDDYAIYTVGYDKQTGETLIRRMTDEELHEIYQYGVDLFLNLENYLPHAQQQ